MTDQAFRFWREKEREADGNSLIENLHQDNVTTGNATHTATSTTATHVKGTVEDRNPPLSVQPVNKTIIATGDHSLKSISAVKKEAAQYGAIKPPRPPLPSYKPSHVLQAELERVKQISSVALDGPPKQQYSAPPLHGIASVSVKHRGSKPALDDSDLFRPRARQVLTPSRPQSAHISQLAERLNLMLSPTPLPQRMRDPQFTQSSHVISHRPRSSKVLSKIRSVASDLSSEDVKEEGEEDEEKLPRWRSFSGSRKRLSSSVKIRSSGFTCYLDGPEERARGDSFCESHKHKAHSLEHPLPSHSPLAHQPSQTPEDNATHLHRPLKPTSSLLSILPTSPLLPKSFSEVLKTSSEPTRNYLTECSPISEETSLFWEMVHRVQSQFLPTIPPHLSAPTLSQQLEKHSPTSSKRHSSISVMAGRTKESLTVAMEMKLETPAVRFQCSANSSVRDVISKGLKRGSQGGHSRSPDEFHLKVCGRDEYMDNSRLLSDYEYVYQCRKFSTEVRVVLVENVAMATSDDGKKETTPPPPSTPIIPHGVSHQEMNALLDSYEAKAEKFKSLITTQHSVASPISIPTLVQSVVSCVKLLCERLSFAEPPDVTEAVYNLRRACRVASFPEAEGQSGVKDLQSLDGWVSLATSDYSSLSEENAKDIMSALDLLGLAVRGLVSLYCSSFQPGYRPTWWAGLQSGRVDIGTAGQHLRVKVAALHRVPAQELRSYDMFQMEVCLYHGGRALSKHAYSPPAKLTRNFFTSVVWDKWLNMGIPLSHIPRESRLCFTLHGLELPGSGYKWTRHPIAWVAIRLFSHSGVLVKGGRLLGLWQGEGGADPLDSAHSNLHSRKSIILQIGFEEYEDELYFPEQFSERSTSPHHPGPPPNIIHALRMVAQKDRYCSLSSEEQTLVWANRFSCPTHLNTYPRGLPSVLLTAPHWHSQALCDVWSVVRMWPYRDPTFGLQLLDAQFVDTHVRSKAVEWLSHLQDDDICDFLPQLVQSLKHECYETSAMVELLLTKATLSQRIAHYLYWNLRLMCSEVRFAPRFRLMLSALELLGGERQRAEFSNQVELVEQLCSVAGTVKASRDSHRQTTLVQELRRVGEKFVGRFRLPLDPALLVSGIDIESCSFFTSNTVPLKLAFNNADPLATSIKVIFKVGDDLRQDILVLQVIRLMEKIWLRAGLDLRMVTYRCVATGTDQGMLELVSDADTLRAIQTQHGLTGSFKDKPLSEWLMRHNPTDSAYKQAVENFTLSCAGYCVATFVLGICDRHNDNIMVRKSGHMFHIDFGKILGNAQMFGNIRRDRTPFVLTRDMAYVINDGDKPTSRFQKFSDLCCLAYNHLRRHSHLFISLLSLMLSSGLPEVSSTDDIQYVRDALLPGKTEAEATYAFTKHIETSLGALATQINFFIHNLAQFKFQASTNAPALLSFCPQSYSIATDGKIVSAIITSFHKRFYPETYYVYQLEVKREDPSASPSTLFRRYREFDEMHSKLLQCFPNDPLPPLPGKIFIPGKSHTRQTSEKRQVELNTYLAALLDMETSISESDIVYTFLHCLLRDEQDLAKLEEETGAQLDTVAGKIKVELSYSYQNLSILVRHVKDLVPREGVESADPYVKLYLLPDAEKITKKKTKVARRTLHPTYNEIFSYKVPKGDLACRSLQLSVWDASHLLAKHCLAVTAIELGALHSDLANGIIEWFELHSPGAQ